MRHHLLNILSRNSNLISNLSNISKNRFLSSSGINLNKKLVDTYKSCLDEPKVKSPYINDFVNYSTNISPHDVSKSMEEKTMNKEDLSLKSNSKKSLTDEKLEKKENLKAVEREEKKSTTSQPIDENVS